MNYYGQLKEHQKKYLDQIQTKNKNYVFDLFFVSLITLIFLKAFKVFEHQTLGNFIDFLTICMFCIQLMVMSLVFVVKSLLTIPVYLYKESRDLDNSLPSIFFNVSKFIRWKGFGIYSFLSILMWPIFAVAIAMDGWIYLAAISLVVTCLFHFINSQLDYICFKCFVDLDENEIQWLSENKEKKKEEVVLFVKQVEENDQKKERSFPPKFSNN